MSKDCISFRSEERSRITGEGYCLPSAGYKAVTCSAHREDEISRHDKTLSGIAATVPILIAASVKQPETTLQAQMTRMFDSRTEAPDWDWDPLVTYSDISRGSTSYEGEVRKSVLDQWRDAGIAWNLRKELHSATKADGSVRCHLGGK
jgi:hypothetical protein